MKQYKVLEGDNLDGKVLKTFDERKYTWACEFDASEVAHKTYKELCERYPNKVFSISIETDNGEMIILRSDLS